jgi:adenine-specific DNA methylase
VTMKDRFGFHIAMIQPRFEQSSQQDLRQPEEKYSRSTSSQQNWTNDYLVKPFRTEDTTKFQQTGGQTDDDIWRSMEMRYAAKIIDHSRSNWYVALIDEPTNLWASTAQEWVDFVNKVKVGGRHQIEFSLTNQEWLVMLFAFMQTDDRDTGARTKIQCTEEIDLRKQHDKAVTIKNMVLRLYEHEALEQMTFDGERIFDPHKTS